MKVQEEQKAFLADNTYALAQSWLYSEDVFPYVILNDDTPVGFVQLDWDDEERAVTIWRIMVDAAHQKHGYGREAIKRVIELCKAKDIDVLQIDYVLENTVARDLYRSMGFKENGKMVEDKENIMLLTISDTPQVVKVTADEEDGEEILELLKAEEEKGMQFPEFMKDQEAFEKAIENEKVERVMICRKTIGFVWGENSYRFQNV